MSVSGIHHRADIDCGHSARIHRAVHACVRPRISDRRPVRSTVTARSGPPPLPWNNPRIFSEGAQAALMSCRCVPRLPYRPPAHPRPPQASCIQRVLVLRRFARVKRQDQQTSKSRAVPRRPFCYTSRRLVSPERAISLILHRPCELRQLVNGRTKPTLIRLTVYRSHLGSLFSWLLPIASRGAAPERCRAVFSVECFDLAGGIKWRLCGPGMGQRTGRLR